MIKHIYLIKSGDNHYKIGVAINVAKRIKALQTSNGNVVELIAKRLISNPSEVERNLHRQLAKRKLNGGREWFELTPNQAIEIAISINKLEGIDASDVQILKDMIMEHSKQQLDIARRLEDLYEQVKAEAMRSEPKLKIPKLTAEEKAEKIKAVDNKILEQAKIIISAENKASTSLLQRRLSIGYGRASRIMDELEERGIIAISDGTNHARKVLV